MCRQSAPAQDLTFIEHVDGPAGFDDVAERAGWQYSIGVRLHRRSGAAIDAIDETAWATRDD